MLSSSYVSLCYVNRETVSRIEIVNVCGGNIEAFSSAGTRIHLELEIEVVLAAYRRLVIYKGKRVDVAVLAIQNDIGSP